MKQLDSVSAVILAGGLARRMGGVDKGLQLLHGKPLYQWVIERLQPQISQISINANRNLQQYAANGLPVFADELPDFQGPLSGMLTALERADTDWVLFVPCDSPSFPLNLLEKLKNFPKNHRSLLAYAADPQREHPTFCLISTELRQNLRQFLESDKRKLLQFMQENDGKKVIFQPNEGEFVNFNRLQDLL